MRVRVKPRANRYHQASPIPSPQPLSRTRERGLSKKGEAPPAHAMPGNRPSSMHGRRCPEGADEGASALLVERSPSPPTPLPQGEGLEQSEAPPAHTMPGNLPSPMHGRRCPEGADEGASALLVERAPSPQPLSRTRERGLSKAKPRQHTPCLGTALLPCMGEGAPKGRMRALLPCSRNAHPHPNPSRKERGFKQDPQYSQRYPIPNVRPCAATLEIWP